MELNTIREPKLKFNEGHENIINPKYGIFNYGPYDYNLGFRKFDGLNIGLIYDKNDEANMNSIIKRFDKEINPTWKQNHVPYGGFMNNYKCEITFDYNEKYYLSEIELDKENDDVYDEIINDYARGLRSFSKDVDVVLLQIPSKYVNYHYYNNHNLHNVIKKLGIGARLKTQLLTDNVLKNPGQDFSDTLWNLSNAIYAKSGGVPWTLRDDLPSSTVFIGICFSIKRTQDADQLILTGVAQVFNQFGHQVVCKVTQCEELRNEFLFGTDLFDGNRSYHLSEEKSKELVSNCLTEYNKQYHVEPSNVIIHKTTHFKTEEMDGMKQAIDNSSVSFVHVVQESPLEIYQKYSGYPVVRGSCCQVGDNRSVLYTCGYVPDKKTYPGPGSPNPIEIRKYGGELSMDELSSQVLALTKMDWNTVKMIVRLPVTLIYAERVGGVIKEGLSLVDFMDDIGYYM